MARFDLTDFEWSVIEPLLPTKVRGVPRVDDRRVLNGIFWHRGRTSRRDRAHTLNRPGIAGGHLSSIRRPWGCSPAWRSNVPRLQQVGYYRWAGGEGGCGRRENG